MLAKKSLGAAPAAEALYVEDVFSTYLYTGNGSTQTITNNIDLSTKGGMVWIKNRGAGSTDHRLFDTNRGIYKSLFSNLTDAEDTSTSSLTAFNTNGFNLSGFNAEINDTSNTYASWTFRQAEKFFDVVTYTGNGNAGRAISHNLGSTPGFIIIKRTDSTSNWFTAHRSVSGQGVALNLTDGVDGTYYALNTNSSDATSTTVTVSATRTNVNGASYVMYLFAHDAGGFGDAGSDSIIKCGSFTSAAGGSATLTLNYEPQWILFKRTDSTGDWFMFDNMRGMFAQASLGTSLYSNTSGAEVSAATRAPFVTSTGLTWDGSTNTLDASATYIYIAIRRGPMKTPEAGTSIYNAIVRTGNNATATVTGVGFPPDLVITDRRSNGANGYWDKLRGIQKMLRSSSTAVESTTTSSGVTSFNMDGITLSSNWDGENASGESIVNWFFRRAPGFFDVVCYTGTGSTRTLTHNLGAVPELIIVKDRSQALDWAVYAAPMGNDKRLLLNTTAIMSTVSWWDNTTPTSTTFKVSSASLVNGSGDNFVAYLFGSLSGISKVGSYSGTGTTQQINCGFTNGARLVLIKRTDSTANWFLWDSARGIVSGNDPYLLLNDTAAEVTNTDYIDTYSAGFELSSTAIGSINGSGGTFIYLAIA